MRPLPTTPEHLSSPRGDTTLVGSTRTLELGPTAPAANHRRTSCTVQRAYPWLLFTSTAMAAAFCALYILKPVVQAAPAAPVVTNEAAEEGLPPGSIVRAPSKPASVEEEVARPSAIAPQTLASSNEEGFEETNLRIQHVLGATGPNGEDLGRITLDIPVLYESGSVRWTREDVSKARSLLERIEDYQVKSRALRDEAIHLISEWDELIILSIPETTLRADSPTLPENQGAGTAEDAPLRSTDAIEIESP
ncbi:MAG: hypothetical protein ACPG4K_05550 [Haloferula sp.]